MFALRLATLCLMCLMSTTMLRASDPSNPPDSSCTTRLTWHRRMCRSRAGSIPHSIVLPRKGYVQSAIVSLRPWTRLSCARLINEAEKRVADDPQAPSDAASLLRSLKEEFAPELLEVDGGRNLEFRLESVDQRSTTIAGRPLTDGYHFAETIVDDYGRPFGEGENIYSGLSFRASAGPIRGLRTCRDSTRSVSDGSGCRSSTGDCGGGFHASGAAGPPSNFTRGRLLDANRLLHRCQQPIHLRQADPMVGAGAERLDSLQQ